MISAAAEDLEGQKATGGRGRLHKALDRRRAEAQQIINRGESRHSSDPRQSELARQERGRIAAKVRRSEKAIQRKSRASADGENVEAVAKTQPRRSSPPLVAVLTRQLFRVLFELPG